MGGFESLTHGLLETSEAAEVICTPKLLQVNVKGLKGVREVKMDLYIGCMI